MPKTRRRKKNGKKSKKIRRAGMYADSSNLRESLLSPAQRLSDGRYSKKISSIFTKIKKFKSKKDVDIDLLKASEEGDLVKVREALNKKANVNIKAQESENTPLHLASWIGNVDVVELLLYAGADIEAKNKNEMTPLHMASEKDHLDVVRFLLAAGANIDATTKYGKKPVDLAYPNSVLVRTLLNAVLKKERSASGKKKKKKTAKKKRSH